MGRDYFELDMIEAGFGGQANHAKNLDKTVGDDVWGHVGCWAFFREEKEAEPDTDEGWLTEAADILGGPFTPHDSPVQNHVTVRLDPKVGRNEPYPCGSGKKFKKCCGA